MHNNHKNHQYFIWKVLDCHCFYASNFNRFGSNFIPIWTCVFIFILIQSQSSHPCWNPPTFTGDFSSPRSFPPSGVRTGMKGNKHTMNGKFVSETPILLRFSRMSALYLHRYGVINEIDGVSYVYHALGGDCAKSARRILIWISDCGCVWFGSLCRPFFGKIIRDVGKVRCFFCVVRLLNIGLDSLRIRWKRRLLK